MQLQVKVIMDLTITIIITNIITIMAHDNQSEANLLISLDYFINYQQILINFVKNDKMFY